MSRGSKKRFTRAEKRAFALKAHPKEDAIIKPEFIQSDLEENGFGGWFPACAETPFPQMKDEPFINSSEYKGIKSVDEYDIKNMSR